MEHKHGKEETNMEETIKLDIQQLQQEIKDLEKHLDQLDQTELLYLEHLYEQLDYLRSLL